MRTFIFRLLNKIYPLRDLDGDIDMNEFHVVGDYTDRLPFIARLNLRVIKCRAYLLYFNGHQYIYATNKKIEDYIVLGMSEVRRL